MQFKINNMQHIVVWPERLSFKTYDSDRLLKQTIIRIIWRLFVQNDIFRVLTPPKAWNTTTATISCGTRFVLCRNNIWYLSNNTNPTKYFDWLILSIFNTLSATNNILLIIYKLYYRFLDKAELFRSERNEVAAPAPWYHFKVPTLYIGSAYRPTIPALSPSWYMHDWWLDIAYNTCINKSMLIYYW